MLTSLRLVLGAIGFVFATQLSASTDLVRVRSGVGIVGGPVQLSGTLDTNGNGRSEILVGARFHVMIVEEDADPRGYREVARLDGPNLADFQGSRLVELPGTPPALLLFWTSRIELRDAATLNIKALLSFPFNGSAVGDVDGDGRPEIVISTGGTVGLFDPETLASLGSLPLPLSGIAVGDIVGDSRAEIISNDGRAYTVTRNGTAYSSTQVWDAGISGTWNPYVIQYQGQAAVVLHDAFGYSAQLATFRPEQPLRTLVPPTGPSFQPLFADANGDGSLDLITSDGRIVRALDIATGLTLWQRDTIYQAPRIGSVGSAITIDLDGDGTSELAWANSGLVAISQPLTGAPRWRSDTNQSRVADWTVITRPGGAPSIAYLTFATQEYPRLGSVGFLDGLTFADQGGSAFAWLPGYNGISRNVGQSAITAFPLPGAVDTVVVSGAESPQNGGNSLTRYLWTFAGDGAFLSERTLPSTTNPDRIVAAQVLNTPERQIVIAGRTPEAPSGTVTYSTRLEIVDYATGNVLWQSVDLPTNFGAPATKLQVADMDADGRLEIIFGYGQDLKVFKPSAGTSAVASYAADQFSLLDRGVGHNAKIATLLGTQVAVYDGLAATPEKAFTLPSAGYGIALFSQAPDDTLMFAISNYSGTTVRRYSDGAIVTYNINFPSLALEAMDLDGDHRIELVGDHLTIWRLENDYIFRNGFDQPAQ